MPNPFYIVDVFSQGPFTGNQLAVVMCEQHVDDETMQRTASEFNFSETTFVAPLPESDGSYLVRIFTPARELSFAGHPILGTAWVIRRHLGHVSTDAIRLQLPVGIVPVNFENEVVSFLSPQARLGAVYQPEQVATIVNLTAQEIDTSTPIQMLTAGVSAIIVPVNSLDVLSRCLPDMDRIATIAGAEFSRLVYFFCRETRDPENNLSARFFFDAHGVREDPATGGVTAFLGYYLHQHRRISNQSIRLRIEQGYSIQRPSLVILEVTDSNRNVTVRVGGRVDPIASGTLSL